MKLWGWQNMIKVTNAEKNIKGKVVLRDINLHFESGKCYVLKGHNGCGKTMLLRLLCGLIRPTAGKVEYKANDPSFGVIIENPTFLESETAEFNLSFLASIKKIIGKQEIERELKRFNLFDHRKQKVSTFSLGMKQRLALAQAVMENPEVLLLDEPFNALDDASLRHVISLLEALKEEGKCIIIASHGNPLEDTDIVDEVITMDNGEVISR